MTQLDWLLLYKKLQRRKFKDNLNLYNMELPSWFRIPDNLKVLRRIDLGQTNISKLPKNLHCKNLWLTDCKNLKELPECLQVENTIILSYSSIERLPKNLQCNSLWLENCQNIKELPEGLNVQELHISKTKLTKEYCFQMKQDRKISYKDLYY